MAGLEAATSILYGLDERIDPLPVAHATKSPRQVLDEILIGALQKPPCIIGFSGGRDSAALLAAASRLAGREGLAAPIAATNVFPGDVQSAESDWQEMVIEHAGIQSWQKLVFTDEMDVIGPIALPQLERFGPTFPFNGHFGVPTLRLAAGGTYLAGVGGDELFEANEMTRLAQVFSLRVRPQRSDLRPALRAIAPQRLGMPYWQRLIPALPWLHKQPAEDLIADLARTIAHQRLWFPAQVRVDVWRDRARAALRQTLRAFGAAAGVEVINPFQDPRFLQAVAAHAGRFGWPSRAAAMQDLFGDVLPPQVINRTSKAGFDGIFFSNHSRHFVEQWDGSGIDTALVDVDRLRQTWSEDSVDARSFSLLQTAWFDRWSRDQSLHPTVRSG